MKMRVDEERKLVFPEVVHTTLRPDVEEKMLISIKLTFLCGMRCEL